MSATAFNRRRRQARAIADAAARDDAVQNTPLNKAMTPEELSEFSRGPRPNMGSPPYPDVARLSSVPGDYDRDREEDAAAEAELNKTRILSYTARETLQNSHLLNEPVKAIPDHDEAGLDNTLTGTMAALRVTAETPYRDTRTPSRDGRIRATETYATRPDVDTTVSANSRGTPPGPHRMGSEDDDPKNIGGIINRANVEEEKIIKENAAVTLVPQTDDPKEAKQKGASKFIETPPSPEASEQPPEPAHAIQPDMVAAAKATEDVNEVPSPSQEDVKKAPDDVKGVKPANETPAEEPKATRGRPKKS
jgi:hypothetical protein